MNFIREKARMVSERGARDRAALRSGENQISALRVIPMTAAAAGVSHQLGNRQAHHPSFPKPFFISSTRSTCLAWRRYNRGMPAARAWV